MTQNVAETVRSCVLLLSSCEIMYTYCAVHSLDPHAQSTYTTHTHAILKRCHHHLTVFPNVDTFVFRQFQEVDENCDQSKFPEDDNTNAGRRTSVSERKMIEDSRGENVPKQR